ncbi:MULTISPECIES: YkgJ family cysteine cluster protein [Pseudomonas]|uniref:YkgJ family cysteine cluster protein n=1 Tax=Pseudomonas TaxID=286 RepID=UPI000876981F|nr:MULTISPECIES: YkgJ family cysteine cluster protein [Pseudomonas]MCU1764545.1 YkgJ family cysteine cluster protein [Pseudomonas protegens]MDK1396499.1 YkgJ family cysteine cluster protein [Pseudomonas protegens]SCZ60059.1 Putative zinc-or iron-chelating domain-containing protein [Pseudomonas sp. NFPP17]SDA53846.1 Putative zinc-or iron-chelating domain-containing protein [Pseudomonas sp. NFPP15]SEK83741.1 Putative zinc-or iron-chelating domain-containing protein [Pseudomonas sp. NFPP18]
MNTQFSCVGCGKCCNDHHVPLTLLEARDWAADGGQVIILVEAFLGNGLGLPMQQREHAERRSCRVRSGATEAYVAITFAAYNVGPCRNLDEDQLCRIYQRRPLVCRIYPMEINPHIPLNPQAKECPPESWEQGPQLILGNELVDQELAELIRRSRQADRDDIHTKEAICALLGIRTTALKGDGFTAYLPDMGALANAIDQVQAAPPGTPGQPWRFHLSGDDIAGQVQAAGAQVVSETPLDYAFISLRAA